MKKVRIIALIVTVMLLSITLVGCGAKPEDYYNRDSLIAGNSNATTKTMSLKSYSAGKLVYNAGTFTGCENISTISISAHMHFEYELTIDSGYFKLVLVADDGTVNIVFETTGEDISGTQHIDLTAANYKMKAVGLNCVNLELDVTIEEGSH